MGKHHRVGAGCQRRRAAKSVRVTKRARVAEVAGDVEMARTAGRRGARGC